MLCKVWVDSENIQHYYCAATVSFTNMTFSLWIRWTILLLRKTNIWFWMENLGWLFFKIYTLWYNDCNWTVPTQQLLYMWNEHILFDPFWLRWKISIYDINTSELKASKQTKNQNPYKSKTHTNTEKPQNYENVCIKPEFQRVQVLQPYNLLSAM